MSTTVDIHPLAAQAKNLTCMSKERLLKTLSFVPDEKLTWSPSPTCKSALRIAAHCAVSNGFFAGLIGRVPMPDMPFEEMMAEGRRREEAISTREQAIEQIEASAAAVDAALDNLTAADIEAIVPTPIFTAPMSFFMLLPGRHMDNHAAQIDMLQTCWGDMDWHI